VIQLEPKGPKNPGAIKKSAPMVLADGGMIGRLLAEDKEEKIGKKNGKGFMDKKSTSPGQKDEIATTSTIGEGEDKICHRKEKTTQGIDCSKVATCEKRGCVRR